MLDLPELDVPLRKMTCPAGTAALTPSFWRSGQADDSRRPAHDRQTGWRKLVRSPGGREAACQVNRPGVPAIHSATMTMHSSAESAVAPRAGDGECQR